MLFKSVVLIFIYIIENINCFLLGFCFSCNCSADIVALSLQKKEGDVTEDDGTSSSDHSGI